MTCWIWFSDVMLCIMLFYICMYVSAELHNYFLKSFYSLEDYTQVLEKEVNIDFCRSMNRIIFEKTVEEDPITFAFVSVPESYGKAIPNTGSLLFC